MKKGYRTDVRKREIKGRGKNDLKMRWLRPFGGALAFLTLPVYGVSWLLFKIAIVRDNRSGFLENPLVKFVINRAGGAMKALKNEQVAESVETGLGFADFKTEIEAGKQWFLNQKKERIVVTSYDGLKLTAYYLPAEQESNKVMILMHGYRNEGGFGDFSGLVEFYHDMGYHLLVPHQRSHGESEGDYICYGVKERYDVKQWAEYIAGRFEGNCSIFLSGISMGGATVLMAAGLELPGQVKGIIADCAFISPWETFSHVIKRDYRLPRFPFLYVADYIAGNRAGFRFKECSTIACMKKNHIPVLFIHGSEDTFVPTEMSYRNYEACAAPKELLIVEKAAHGTSNLVEPETYREAVISFMEKYTGNGDGNGN